MMKWLITIVVASCILSIASANDNHFVPGNPVDGDFDGLAVDFLETHCYECHDDLTSEADLNLLDLGPVDETNVATWKSVWAQVTVGEMPPKKRDQPEVIERLKFSQWIVDELSLALEKKGGFHADKDPHKGNFVDHQLLFGERPELIRLEPTSSPARLWRLTRQEHITRLNDLINTEPAYDPKRPGQRTHGDEVPTNHGGELKLYFGTDRITHWDGGTVAYATAVKSVPAILASNHKHGFENYAHFYSVNNAEATRIMSKADDILRYMAFGPMSLVKFPEQITDEQWSYLSIKPEGDLRGLPSSIIYNTKVVRPITPVFHLMQQTETADQEKIEQAVEYLFEALTYRPPSNKEKNNYISLVNQSIEEVGIKNGIFLGLSAIFLDRDALFRTELVEHGDKDQYGRTMMRNWELGLAVNHALCYTRPNTQLKTAITSGKMRTHEDVDREISRMLEDDSIRKPRVLQFFRDYFDYDIGGYICKDSDALAKTGLPLKGDRHYRAMFEASASTDRLVELILAEDKDVLKQLLTTQKVIASSNDDLYFGRQQSPEEAAIANSKFTEADQDYIEGINQKKAKLAEKLKTAKDRYELEFTDKAHKRFIEARYTYEREVQKLNQRIAERQLRRGGLEKANLRGERIFARVGHRSFGKGSLKPERSLATAPEGQRMGILTHPSWLTSHSDAMDNHAILRGRWIRERLLGGGIPDVPITVDAQLPDEPNTPLRERMRVTRQEYCWSCHDKMDPLGLPFEMYNHVGIYRKQELGEPVDTSGEILESGDPNLDGPVTDAIDMIKKLAESEHVEQVFVRHAFRYWMGRNETLNDAPALQAAHRAYRDNGGSMKALIRSLVTSDAFLYRKVEN